jgi:4-hydroxy-tetrahydrodipicolinate synthase
MMTAMVTPFDAAGGVDHQAARALVAHLIATGTTSLLVCGTTGESPTLCHDEKLALLDTVKDAVDGRVPVLMGTGSNCTRSTVDFTAEVTARGVDGVLVVCPYYNKPTQDGLYEHFAAAARASAAPVMVYNIESRSARNILPDTMARLAAEVPNIVALKEASGSINQFAAMALALPDGFRIYSGNDSDTPAILCCGGVGVVSVASHVVGLEMRRMIDAFLGGDFARGRALYLSLMPLVNSLFHPASVSPAPVKAALEMLGVRVGGLRLPLVPADDVVCAAVRSSLERLGRL